MKRNLFDELTEGFEALQQERQSKLTLRKYKLELREPPRISNTEIVQVRERLNLSQAVFASHLRISPRTLQNWEQGRTKPPTHTAMLMRMVEKYPDTLQRLEQV